MSAFLVEFIEGVAEFEDKAEPAFRKLYLDLSTIEEKVPYLIRRRLEEIYQKELREAVVKALPAVERPPAVPEITEKSLAEFLEFSPWAVNILYQHTYRHHRWGTSFRVQVQWLELDRDSSDED